MPLKGQISAYVPRTMCGRCYWMEYRLDLLHGIGHTIVDLSPAWGLAAENLEVAENKGLKEPCIPFSYNLAAKACILHSGVSGGVQGGQVVSSSENCDGGMSRFAQNTSLENNNVILGTNEVWGVHSVQVLDCP